MTRSSLDASSVTVRDILYVAFKYRLGILGILLAAIVGATVYLVMAKRVFVAETKILVQLGREKSDMVETTTAKSNVIVAARPEDIRNEIEILKDMNLTMAVLPGLQKWLEQASRPPESVLDHLRLWASRARDGVSNLAMQPAYLLGLATRLTPEQQFALSVHGAVNAEPADGTDVVKVRFSWSNPEFAAYAANAVAQEYVRQRIRLYSTTDAQRFYGDQIRIYQERLASIEKDIEQFRKSRGVSNLELQRELVLREISQLERDHEEAGVGLKELQAKIDAVRQSYERTPDWIETPMVGVVVPDMTALDRRYVDLLAERNRLLETDTAQSRAVRALATQMQSLRAQKHESLQNFLRTQVASVAKRRQSAGEMLGAKRQSLAELDRTARTLREMERQRGFAEREFTDYSKKAEDFRISDALSQQRITSVRILGSALPPPKPEKPWVTVILSLAAFLGVFLGFAYATISEFFDHSVRDKSDVEAVLGVPLLAALPDVHHHARVVARPSRA